MDYLVRSEKQAGTVLRRQRRAQKLTQAQLADRAGVRQGTISLMESGAKGTRLSTIMDVLRVLDFEIVIRPRTKGSHQDIENMF